MKNFIMIEKSTYVSAAIGEASYYSITNAATNKNWIVQYDTTFESIIYYAMGYLNGLDINENNIFFHESCFKNNSEKQKATILYLNLDIRVLNEVEFKNKQKALYLIKESK